MLLQLGWPGFIFGLFYQVLNPAWANATPLVVLLAILCLLTWFVMIRLADILAAKGQDDVWKYVAVLGLLGILIVLALPDTGKTATSRGFEVVGVNGEPIPTAQIADARSPDTVQIAREPLSTARCIGLVSDDRAGGVAVFIGTTRAQPTGDPKRQLVALDYEAYTEMADRQMRDLAQKARQQWPILRLAIAHRIGRVSLGQPSVIVAVSTPHRADAFAACRWIIDTLKSSAAIWKKEVWSDGTTTWVGEREGSA